MKPRVMIRFIPCVAILCGVACGGNEPLNQEPDAAPGFELFDEVDMSGESSDMSSPRDASPDLSIVDMQGVDDMPGGADLTTVSEMGMTVEDMPKDLPADDMSEDMLEDLSDMSEPDMDMMTTPDLGPGVYPPVTSAPLGGGGRPAEVLFPAGFDNTREVPLIIALHGYGGDKDEVGRYFSLKRDIDHRDFILISPEGTRDTFGSRFWNATDGCCNAFGSNVNDSAYLRGLIEEALQRFRIDRGRIYAAGYSNGGFMAYRLACDSADYITGIFSLAGGTFKDAARCQPSRPVQILQLHGTADQTIGYNGGSAYPTAPAHPGALETVTHWAGYNGCQTTPVMLDSTAVNAVTVEQATVQGFNACPADGQVELWTLPGAPHNPGLPQTMGAYLLDRLFAIDRTP